MSLLNMFRRESQIVEFYKNNIKLRGNSEVRKIDYIHEHWSKDYKRLERYHGYIQWIFPNKVRSMFNMWAPVISDEECEVFKKSDEIRTRMVKSTIMMLDFWGFELEEEQKEGDILLKRCASWETQLRNLYGHNLLRVTRMLKFWGLVGMENWQYPFVLRCLFEIFIMGELKGSLDSVKRFWIPSVVDKDDKKSLLKHFNVLTTALTKAEEFRKLAEYPAFEPFRKNTPEFEGVFKERLTIIERVNVSRTLSLDESLSRVNVSREITNPVPTKDQTEIKAEEASPTERENIMDSESKIQDDVEHKAGGASQSDKENFKERKSNIEVIATTKPVSG